MTQTKVTLPPSIVALLFENVLIDPQKEPRSSDVSVQQGGFSMKPKKINTVVIYASPDDFLAPEQEVFLQSILSACKLNKVDVAVISDKNPNAADHKSITENYAPQYVLLMGVKPSSIQLPVHFPEFQIQSIGQVKFVCTPPLESIQYDKSLKAQLWKTLQKLFQL